VSDRRTSRSDPYSGYSGTFVERQLGHAATLLPVEIGAVRLNVADLDGVREYYERTIGLRVLEQGDDVVSLGSDGTALVELRARAGAPRRPPGTTGLFHLAILVPSRVELAQALRRVADSRRPLTGASDHLVSEAVYLRDPEGNGIEIYRDRPREEWPRADGVVQMDTLPLDIDGVFGELDTAEPPHAEAPPATRIGHVHLQVSDLGSAEAFYVGALGFDVMVRSYPGALFVSHAGYHHHIGLNTWAGEGAPAPPPGALGLDEFEIVVDGESELDALAGRLDAAGVAVERRPDGLRTADPSGNGVLLRTAS
jgi:catechol 2,3-dioxygenase